MQFFGTHANWHAVCLSFWNVQSYNWQKGHYYNYRYFFYKKERNVKYNSDRKDFFLSICITRVSTKIFNYIFLLEGIKFDVTFEVLV